MTLKISYVLAILSQGLGALAQNQAQFNQVLTISGDMTLNSLQFPDGSKIETFSQTQRQLLVNQNTNPLPGNQVTGTTGNPFVALSQNSLVIQTSNATDLVGAQIELPINAQTIQQNGVTADNTFVAKLSQDRQSWMVMDTIKTVNITDNTVRIVKMNNIDGEYIALGRQTTVTGVALTQFGLSTNMQFNVTGSGIQENEYTDGIRMSIRGSQPMTVNVNVANGISATMLTALGSGSQSVNNYRYLVQTNLGSVSTTLNRVAAVMQLPVNPLRLQTIANTLGATSNSNIQLSIAQRSLLQNPGGAQGSLSSISPNKRANNNGTSNGSTGSSTSSSTSTSTSTSTTIAAATNVGSTNGGTGTSNNPAATQLLLSPTFTPITNQAVFDTLNARLAVPVTQIDGEYILVVKMAGGSTTGTTGTGTTGGTSGAQPAAISSGTSPLAGGTTSTLTVPALSSSTSKSESSTTAEPAVATSVPAASEPSAASPAAASPAPAAGGSSSGFIFRRQLPPLPQSQSDGSVIISMELVNYMANIVTQGGAINVDAMMASVGVSAPATAAPATAALGSSSVTSGLIAREFKA